MYSIPGRQHNEPYTSQSMSTLRRGFMLTITFSCAEFFSASPDRADRRKFPSDAVNSCGVAQRDCIVWSNFGSLSIEH